MTIAQDSPMVNEEEYDEEADSDFQADDFVEDGEPSSSDSEGGQQTPKDQGPQKRQKFGQDDTGDLNIELDSGDEATIKEQKKARKRSKKKDQDVGEQSDDEQTGWRAKTRAMREQEKDEQKRRKLAKVEGSTIDVDKVWQEMNRAGPLPPVEIVGNEEAVPLLSKDNNSDEQQEKENIPALNNEELITIKRKFKFAGEVHFEEKTVLKSSAEARLWLAQQDIKSQPTEVGAATVLRPLRKLSRFDPNFNNLDAFKIKWTKASGTTEPFKGPKLNVVEKSKMDWASHVDAEGLKDELDEHAKAKEGYHGRMEFLNQVEQRKEDEARQARTKR